MSWHIFATWRLGSMQGMRKIRHFASSPYHRVALFSRSPPSSPGSRANLMGQWRSGSFQVPRWKASRQALDFSGCAPTWQSASPPAVRLAVISTSALAALLPTSWANSAPSLHLRRCIVASRISALPTLRSLDSSKTSSIRRAALHLRSAHPRRTLRGPDEKRLTGGRRPTTGAGQSQALTARAGWRSGRIAIPVAPRSLARDRRTPVPRPQLSSHRCSGLSRTARDP